MPLYEYQCDQCGQVFEVIQKFVDAPLTTHEKCGGGSVHRLLSAPALQFKGSGFYVNDYAKNSSSSSGNGPTKKTDSTASSSSSDSDSSKASTTPSDSKPSSSSDTK